jgi:hypothetical protein
LSTDGSFNLQFGDGYSFRSGALAAALSLFGEAVEVQDAAEETVSFLNVNYQYSTVSVDMSKADQQTFIHEAASDSIVNDVPVVPYRYNRAKLLNMLLKYYDDDNHKRVEAYERGLAAFCVYSLMSQFASVDSSVYGQALKNTANAIKEAHAPTTTLGRIHTNATELIVDAEATWNASITTIPQVVTPSIGSYDEDCLTAMRAFFADEVDATRFQKTINTNFYDRLESLFSDTRTAVANVVTTSPINEVLRDPASVKHDVEDAGIRIVGAPRGSWAGLEDTVRDPQFSSSDGMIRMLLKKCHAFFQQHIMDTAVHSTVRSCDVTGPYESTELNAIIYVQPGCALIYLGMLKRPWADQAYDDASLTARLLGVLGHELGHLSLNTQYVEDAYNDMLSSYDSVTRKEGIADVVAALAAIQSGRVTRDEFVDHWCQLWCARVPFGYTYPSDYVHPGPNERCDHLDATLKRLGV